ncbi:hypothetical protein NP493_285g03034 [Ridgeia piscesae]|uniref:Glycosyltransferase n=1 Tax=Ridgeia piscesae TaxID=27915 RepID=A0AAD9UC45_RIDPI|nr:hypothetical protein NP493_285g03034 [Ridgeia piscesae]
MRCGEQDFLNLIRVQGGAEPKLLSARTEPVKEGLYGDRREYVVPNIVHFIWFHHPLEFKFRTYLTYLSVYKFIKPHYILLHGDVTPTGYWWNRTVADVPNIYHVHVDDKKSMFGQNFAYPSQHSDVLRLYVILDYGGIYLDHDAIVVKSFNPLRKFDLTIGRESDYSLNGGVMLGRQGAPFLQLWLETYRSPNLNLKKWGYDSVRMAHHIWEYFPHLVHVEETSLAHPNYLDPQNYYRDPYDWSGNYAVHLMREQIAKIPNDPKSLKGYDCLLGQVMRLVYFGDQKLLSNVTWKGMK